VTVFHRVHAQSRPDIADDESSWLVNGRRIFPSEPKKSRSSAQRGRSLRSRPRWAIASKMIEKCQAEHLPSRDDGCDRAVPPDLSGRSRFLLLSALCHCCGGCAEAGGVSSHSDSRISASLSRLPVFDAFIPLKPFTFHALKISLPMTWIVAPAFFFFSSRLQNSLFFVISPMGT
jgi:hypothetical protein